jgi:cytochrome c oxidase subunit 2
MQQIPTSLITLLAGIIITVISFWYGQNNHLLPEAVSVAAPMVDQLFNVMVTIGTALFIIVQGIIIYIMIRYRRPPGDDTDGSPVEGNVPLEILWTAIPAVIVIGLGIYSVNVFQEMGGFTAGSAGMAAAHAHHHAMPSAGTKSLPADSALAAPAPNGLIATTYGIGEPGDTPMALPDVLVNVTGMQFAWLFEYPGKGVTVGELHVPVGKSIKLQMKAVDVLHAFWLPQFRIKQDVMPGLDSELQFVATKTGTYPVFCAELCGSYHGSMRTQIIVEEPEAYEKWLMESQIAQAGSPPIAQLSVPSPTQMSDREFLQPYAQKIGLDPQALASLY